MPSRAQKSNLQTTVRGKGKNRICSELVGISLAVSKNGTGFDAESNINRVKIPTFGNIRAIAQLERKDAGTTLPGKRRNMIKRIIDGNNLFDHTQFINEMFLGGRLKNAIGQKTVVGTANGVHLERVYLETAREKVGHEIARSEPDLHCILKGWISERIEKKGDFFAQQNPFILVRVCNDIARCAQPINLDLGIGAPDGDVIEKRGPLFFPVTARPDTLDNNPFLSQSRDQGIGLCKRDGTCAAGYWHKGAVKKGV